MTRSITDTTGMTPRAPLSTFFPGASALPRRNGSQIGFEDRKGDASRATLAMVVMLGRLAS